MPLDQHASISNLSKKQSGMAWARTFYLIGIASALIFVLPVAWFPVQLGKMAIFALFLLLSVIAFSLGGGWKVLWRASGTKLALVTGVLPVIYLISAYFAHTLPFSFVGSGAEADSIVFAALAFFAFMFSFVLFRTSRSAWLLLSVIFYSLIAAAVFQLVSITIGSSVIPFAAFADRTVNLLGKWNDLGIVTGLLLLMTVIRLEFSSLSRLYGILMIVLGIVALALMAFINFSFIWGLLIVSLVILVLFKLLQQPIASPERAKADWKQHLPWFGLGATALLIAFLFFGTVVNTHLTNVFPVTALEVRPSFSSTMDVINAGRGDSVKYLMLGTGPATFGTTWLMHKPAEVNQSIFWNFDFVVGFSTVVTALGTVGVLGALAWIVAPFLVMLALVRSLRTALFHSRERALATMLGISSIFLSFVFIFYIPSQNLLILTFTIMGAAFGFLWRSAQKEHDIEEVRSSRLASLGRAVFALVAIVLVFGSSVAVVRRALSETFVQRGQVELGNGQTDAALARAGEAAWFETTSDVAILKLAAGFGKLQQIASDSSLPAETAQERFSTALTSVVDAGRQAIALSPNDYRPYLVLGNIYAFLSSLKIDGAYENARTAYQTAATYNPKDPEISLALARLEADKGNTQLAEDAVTEALTLKQDYTDAILFVVQLDVANNDIPNAISAATAAVQTAPGVSSIWFQLGLLYYTSNDMTDAITALEKALSITPDYANAQYFLGLAYYAQSRPQDAIALFEGLQKSNPDNSEVTLILNNFRSGKQPFDGAQPPVTDNPEDRTTAPLEQ